MAGNVLSGPSTRDSDDDTASMSRGSRPAPVRPASTAEVTAEFAHFFRSAKENARYSFGALMGGGGGGGGGGGAARDGGEARRPSTTGGETYELGSTPAKRRQTGGDSVRQCQLKRVEGAWFQLLQSKFDKLLRQRQSGFAFSFNLRQYTLGAWRCGSARGREDREWVGLHRGGALNLHPRSSPVLTAPDFSAWKLTYNEPLSNQAFDFNSRHHSTAARTHCGATVQGRVAGGAAARPPPPPPLTLSRQRRRRSRGSPRTSLECRSTAATRPGATALLRTCG